MYDVEICDVPGSSQANDATSTAVKQFRMRLIGTALADNFAGISLRGQLLSVLPSPLSEHVHQHLTRVSQIRQPLRTQYSVTGIPGQEFQTSESCYAPLSTNGTDIDIVIAVTILGNRK